ncbi:MULTISPECIES: hypothetical protein [Acidiphilium]|uniref:Uncharacterized protein n=1 Tax=Acidiphilium cryptum (strain JF-5) TaxID=349163 RepID=A5FTW6_ACICJ|nr:MULTISPECIES: hypothetical protein [Acidiphilium]ABQ29048.1 hypothetical protein Acry_3444 [Acidiphilium cryptum JF-5]KDM68341.1 hypothetical protein ACIDI_7c00220 [Acidiphilium sp. JA12-A1]UNC16455.1 hypothetical protein FE249_19950 [Acidiphilium multivorum]
MSSNSDQKIDFSATFGLSKSVPAMIEARDHLGRHFPTRPWEDILLGAVQPPAPIEVVHYSTGAVAIFWTRGASIVCLLYQGDGCVFHGQGSDGRDCARLGTMSYVEEVLPRSVMLEILAVCRQKG